MALEIKHTKVIPKLDGEDPDLLQPSHWNAAHKITVPAASLIGRAAASEGDAEAITIGAGLELDNTGNILSSKAIVLETADIIVGTAISPSTPMPNHRVLTDTASVKWDIATANQAKANIGSRGVTLAMMELGLRGDLLTYGTGDAPLRLAAGEFGQTLVAGGAAADLAWGWSGAPHALVAGVMSAGSNEGAFTSGAWRTRLLDTQVYDAYGLVLVVGQGSPAVGVNRFRLNAGTYVVEWSAPAFSVNKHQTRLYNATDAVAIAYGTSAYSNDNNPSQTISDGVARFTIAANKDLEIQHQCQTTNAQGLGVGSGFGSGNTEVFSRVKIWRVS